MHTLLSFGFVFSFALETAERPCLIGAAAAAAAFRVQQNEILASTGIGPAVNVGNNEMPVRIK